MNDMATVEYFDRISGTRKVITEFDSKKPVIIGGGRKPRNIKTNHSKKKGPRRIKHANYHSRIDSTQARGGYSIPGARGKTKLWS